MADDTTKRRENDARQGGEGNPAYGEDARDFGAGGQTTSGPTKGRKEDRDPTRDRSLDPAMHNPSQARGARRD